MLVPLQVAVPLGGMDDVMPLPGAYTSVQVPQLLKPDLWSLVWVTLPTVMASAAEAGE